MWDKNTDPRETKRFIKGGYGQLCTIKFDCLDEIGKCLESHEQHKLTPEEIKDLSRLIMMKMNQ